MGDQDRDTQRQSFKVKGMDCGEEVAVLKREVGPLIGGESGLAFDLLAGKMTVVAGVDRVEAIMKAVAATGMEAIPWARAAREEESFWERRGRAVLCLASGLMLGLGFVLQAVHLGGFIDALTAEVGHDRPLWVIAAFLGAVICGGWFIYPKAFFALRRMRPDMNLLMTLAVAGAIVIGEWFEAGAVSFLFAAALLLESWSVGRARRAIEALVSLAPSTARYRCPDDDEILEKPIEEVPVGVVVLVRPGESIPLDGVVVSGATTVDQASITGESRPIPKEVGSEVFAGTLNGEGAIAFRCTAGASDTQLARIIQMVEEAQSRRAPSEQWVERFARIYTPAMMILAVLIAVGPPLILGASWGTWFYQALVILVIACPCALVISTPVSIVAGLATAAKQGVLIKGGIHLETPARLRAIAMDKTGTLTHGRPVVQAVIPLGDHSATELLKIAAALEANSTHPLARAILARAASEGLTPEAATDFQSLTGRGAQGLVDGKAYWIGSHRLLEERGVETAALHDRAASLEAAGHSLVVVGSAKHACGLITVADAVRENAAKTLEALKALGVEEIVMLTGDNKTTAEAVAAQVGVTTVKAECLPEDKVVVVGDLVARHTQVAMIGDGVNDAPALAAATLGIAMGAMGTAAAVETADIALMSDDLSRLPWLISHARRTLAVIKQNIVFALGLKALFIVLALAGLATLWMAIAADMGASLLVIFNGLRLLRDR